MAGVVLLDTGPIVAQMEHREQHHEWAKGGFARLEVPIKTCLPVLTEAFFILGNQSGPLEKLRHLWKFGTLWKAFASLGLRRASRP